MTFEQVVHFQLSSLQACFQGFKTFTSVAVKWPLTSTNYNRRLLLTKVNLHAKYEVCPSCTFGVYKVFGLLPLLQSNDLWPAPISIGFLYSLRWTYIPSMKFDQVVHRRHIHIHTHAVVFYPPNEDSIVSPRSLTLTIESSLDILPRTRSSVA